MSSTVSLVHTTDDSARVDVTVPLRPEFASIVRLIAASLGADAGFTVDDIDDLRLALSEVFSSLVDAATVDADERVAIAFDTSGPGLSVTLSTLGSGGRVVTDVVLDELAASIISVAVDEFHVADGLAKIVKLGSEQPVDQTES
jgi:anti-sigma regulatory factor (Ser/Thr protein kinase)